MGDYQPRVVHLGSGSIPHVLQEAQGGSLGDAATPAGARIPHLLSFKEKFKVMSGAGE